MVSHIQSSCTDPPVMHEALCKVWFHDAEAQALAVDKMKHKPFGATARSLIIAIVGPDDHRESAAAPTTTFSASLIGGPQMVSASLIGRAVGRPRPALWSTFDYLFVHGLPALVPWAKARLDLKPEDRILSVNVEVEDEEVDQGTWKMRKTEKVIGGTWKSRKEAR